jgi:hypothetical protein
MENFDRDERPQNDVLSFEHGAHSAVAKRANEPVLSLDYGSDANHASH